MSYVKQEFKSGEKLYASQLNAMDDQIAKNEQGVASLNEEIEKLGQNGGGNVAVDATLTKEGMAADAAAVGQRFDDMLVPSKNLITGEWVQGGFDANTGVENNITPTNWRLNGWIAVKPNTPYTFTQWTGEKIAGVYHMWYDSEKNFIKRTAYGPGSPSGAPTTQTSPENAAYLRLYIYSSVGSEAAAMIATSPVQLEEGDVGTGYRKSAVFNIDYFPEIPERLIVHDDALDYYMMEGYLVNKVSRINELARSVGADGDAFIFISDTHWEKNAKKSPALLKYLHEHTHIDRLFGGGDYMDNALTPNPPLFECVDALRDTWTGKRYLTLGNHDYMGSEAYALKDKDLYYAVNSYGTERVGNLKRNYYYVDNPQTKLRYIVLNRYIDRIPVNNEINGLNEEQRTWLQNVALDVEDGWGVLVFIHDLYRFIYGDDGYTATISLNYTDSRATVEILDAFVDGGGTVVGIFCGENHVDMVHRTPGGIPVITTTCDKNKSGGEGVPISDQWAERLDGTINEQAFDVMVVDKANRTIHAVRIGYPARNSVDGAWGEKVGERTIAY